MLLNHNKASNVILIVKQDIVIVDLNLGFCFEAISPMFLGMKSILFKALLHIKVSHAYYKRDIVLKI